MSVTVRTWHTLATEAQLQETLRVVALRGGWRYFHNYDARRSPAGFPDIIAIRNGCMVVFEVKKQKGRVSAQQQDWIDAFGSLGFNVRAAVVRPDPKPGEMSFSAAVALLERGAE